jgi:hypothetical protein
MMSRYLTFSLVGSLLLLQSSQTFALPDCPKSGPMDNCFGTVTFSSGSKYVGEFKDGNYSGQGTYTYADGEEYVGAFKDGLFHKQGTYTYSSGDKYVGEFKNGEKNGRGLYSHTDGTSEKGFFKDGEFLYETKVK